MVQHKNIYRPQTGGSAAAGCTFYVAVCDEPARLPYHKQLSQWQSQRSDRSNIKEMLEFLMEHKYIKMENYFCDGSTFAADANKHKMVWKKNAERYKASAEQKCLELFKQIDELNAAEDKEYGSNNWNSRVNHQLLQKKILMSGCKHS